MSQDIGQGVRADRNCRRGARAWLVVLMAGLGAVSGARAQCTVPFEIETIISGDPNTGDLFGASVAVSGDTIAVGAPGDDGGSTDLGAVYIFTRSGNNWIQQQKILPSDVGASRAFGQSIALAGSTLLVGAPGVSGGGAAYIFNLSGGVWSQTIKLTASDRVAGDDFGRSVALSAAVNRSIAIIGAPGDDNNGPTGTTGGTDTGAVYVFTLNTITVGSVWGERDKLLPTDGGAGDLFGRAVAAAGTVAVIGAPSDDNIGGFDAGSVYAFTGDFTAANWTQEAKLLADGSGGGLAGDSDAFGSAVAISGGTAVIGAPRWEGSPNSNSDDNGAMYIFERSGSVWMQTQFLGEVFSGISFGESVTLLGTRMIGGKPGPLSNFATRLISKTGGVWAAGQQFTTDAGRDENFGCSVALGSTIAVFGASEDGVAGPATSGSVRVFDLVVQDVLTYAQHPQNAQAQVGGTAVFSAALAPSNVTSLFYRWEYEAVPNSNVWTIAQTTSTSLGTVTGWETPMLTISNLTSAAFTRYRARFIGP